MNQLAKNKFLTVIGVVFLVCVIAFAVLVYPAWGTASAKTKSVSATVSKIKQATSELPGEPNTAEWNAHADKMKTRYGKSLEELAKLDRNLGDWFAEVDNDSTFDYFMNKYDDEVKKLQGELQEKGVLLGSPQVGEDNKLIEAGLPGFNWLKRTDILVRNNEEERAAKEILQKRFNICRAIVNAVTQNVDKSAPKGRERRLLDVTFLEKFKFSPPGRVAETGEGRTFSMVLDHRRYTGYAGPGSGTFMEYTLPRNGDLTVEGGEDKQPWLGRTITVGFAVALEYGQVPELVRSILEPGVEPELNLAIVGMNVFVPKPNPAEVKETVNLKAEDDVEAIRKEYAARSAASLPPQVNAYVTLQIIDFEPAAVPAYLKQ